MKKISLILIIFSLILSTTIIKNSAKKTEDKIFTVRENLRILNSEFEKIKLESARIYLSTTNLFTISKFKIWDVEMGGNGLGYPLQRGINLGLNMNF